MLRMTTRFIAVLMLLVAGPVIGSEPPTESETQPCPGMSSAPRDVRCGAENVGPWIDIGYGLNLVNY